MISGLLILQLWISSCKQSNNQNEGRGKTVEFNQGLADELKAMGVIDQIAAGVPQGKFKNWDQFNPFKDSVFSTHKIRLEEIFNQFGYPGYSLVGDEGESNFWKMIQHCDAFPEFQSKVLEKLEKEVAYGNADRRNFGLLTDRVKLNTGEKQIYGTQVTYNSLGQAFPRPLADIASVNGRRADVGLEPLEQYLNVMTQMHFEMNKEYLMSKGITEPKLYKLKN